MLIVNADDYGRCKEETDFILSCHQQRRITSATAMVFMTDSIRAAELSRDSQIDLGLHLNLSEPFTAEVKNARLRECHNRVVRFITSNRYSVCLYNPVLRQEFRYVYEAQLDEFMRLYGRGPSHIDGHHHTHLCSNMVFGGIIDSKEKVRRSFSFHSGEKSFLNRTYRRMIDGILARRHRLTDFFFSLQQCLREKRLSRVFELSASATVELMTHPSVPEEYTYLMSENYRLIIDQLHTGTYASI